MDHDFYWLFSHFWWLIFPLFWMVAMMARLWSRHSRANRALDIVKSYADQGKDPPPELLKTLQHDSGSWGYGCGGRRLYGLLAAGGWQLAPPSCLRLGVRDRNPGGRRHQQSSVFYVPATPVAAAL
jgi:hypothetical protein